MQSTRPIRPRFRPFRRPARWISASLALGLVLVLGPGPTPPADATTLVALDDDQLVDLSSLIVTGTCVAARGEWREGMLVTLATVRVDRLLKTAGTAQVAAGGEITVVIPGGVDADRPVPIAVTLPGAPSLAPGDRSLLFLYGLGDSAAPAEHGVTGLFQGELDVVEGADGVSLVRALPSGASAQSRGRGAGTRAMPLAQMEARIRARVEASSGVPTGGAR